MPNNKPIPIFYWMINTYESISTIEFPLCLIKQSRHVINLDVLVRSHSVPENSNVLLALFLSVAKQNRKGGIKHVISKRSTIDLPLNLP